MSKARSAWARWIGTRGTPRRRVLVGAGLTAAAALVFWGSCQGLAMLALRRADPQLQKGFHALAAETLDPHRRVLSRSENGCRGLIAAYFGARRPERLEWAAQACLEAGVEIPESYIGMAAARELMNRDTEALAILNQVAPRFPQSPNIVYRIAQILRRNKQDANAVTAYLEAARRAPGNAQLAMDALEYFSALGRWDDARRMAETLKGVPSDNPEVRLVIARALKKGGDEAGAQALIQVAQALLASKPELQAPLQKAYPDLLGDVPAPSASKPQTHLKRR